MNNSNFLIVYFNEKIVGELRLIHGDRYEFQYQDSWLKYDQSFPISLALKLQSEPHDHVTTKSFFEGLIPEEDFLRNLKSTSHKHINSAFDFLTSYGRDCAGALRIVPLSSENENRSDLKKISWSELSKSYIQNRNLANIVLNEEGGFFSLAGAQDKISLVKLDGDFFISRGDTPSTHIIKPPNRFHQSINSVYNEFFCMRLAKAIALNVPETDLIESEVSFYVIERFDRNVIDKNITRLHQHDFCQALGILNTQKYEILGGPSLRDNFQLILNNSSEVISDSKRFLRWIFFNLLIGNNDCHAKNLSFILQGQKLVLSPFYDLLSTSVYPTIRNKFALKIAGQVVWSEIKSKHLRLVEKDLNLKNQFLSDLLQNLIEELEIAIPVVMQELALYKDHEVFEKIILEINRRIKHFKKI